MQGHFFECMFMIRFVHELDEVDVEIGDASDSGASSAEDGVAHEIGGSGAATAGVSGVGGGSLANWGRVARHECLGRLLVSVGEA